MESSELIVLVKQIEEKIYIIRGKKVMLDFDLSELYGVETKYLNRQVIRNIERFDADFMFQLTSQELTNWKCQIGTSNPSIKMGLRKRPYAFTELGVAMLSSVLNSHRAIQVNMQIMRTFTKIREFLMSHKELQDKIEKLEKKYDTQFKVVFDAMRELITPNLPPKRPIGFRTVD